jgi:hypothetical protein
MSIKTITLAAAIAVTGSIASADSYFAFGETLDHSSALRLGVVRADADGVVEIHDYRSGEIGALLGTQTVRAGANSNVRVNVGIPPTQDVIALLKIDGEIVAMRDYNISR